jgi:hypothetical protein
VADDTIRAALSVVLKEMGASDTDVHLERPRDPTHGDVATNVALTLAKPLRRSPREIAEEIASRLDLPSAGVESVDVAGPGFLNFRLSSGSVVSVVDDIVGGDEPKSIIWQGSEFDPIVKHTDSLRNAIGNRVEFTLTSAGAGLTVNYSELKRGPLKARLGSPVTISLGMPSGACAFEQVVVTGTLTKDALTYLNRLSR